MEIKQREPTIEKAIERGWKFLESEIQNGFFPSYLSSERGVLGTRQVPREVFSSMVIADTLLNDHPDLELARSVLLYIKKQERGQFTYFEDGRFPPADVDTNALGYSVLLENQLVDATTANEAADIIFHNTNEEGIIKVWLSNNMTNTIDHVVCANALYLSYLLGREEETKTTEDWLEQLLNSNKHVAGSRYYHSPDTFLYILGRSLKFPAVKGRFNGTLRQRLQERIGTTNYPLDLAMRTALAYSLEIENSQEKQKLLDTQQQDGSWPPDALSREGEKVQLYGLFYGNKTIPTAFSIRALESVGF